MRESERVKIIHSSYEIPEIICGRIKRGDTLSVLFFYLDINNHFLYVYDKLYNIYFGGDKGLSTVGVRYASFFFFDTIRKKIRLSKP